MADLERLLRELVDPQAYPEAAWGGLPVGARRVEVVQTHISVVFLTARRAYKVKKPLSLWGLVDYSTFEARRHWCEEEVRLNRRLAPDLYLGVVAIREQAGRWVVGEVGGPGDPQAPGVVEHAVAMRRFRPEDTLEQRVLAGTVAPRALEALGRRLARFHDAWPLAGADLAALTPRQHAEVLAQNVRSTRSAVPALLPGALHAALERRLAQGLCALRGRMRARLRSGAAVNGHGDVRLEHVLLEGEGRREGGDEAGVSILDTVEFSPRLRHIDRLSDAAFLAMDLLTRGRCDLAEAFLQGYGVRPEERPLLWHFAAYRAHVRAKVDVTVAQEAEVPEAQRARARVRARGHLALAWTLATRGVLSPALVLLRGPSGSGKSVLAGAIAPWLDAEVVRSDLVRKELFGLHPLERPSSASLAEVYGPAAGARTYAEVLRRGLAALAGGRHALLDATYLRADARAQAREAAERVGAPLRIVNMDVPPEVVRERLERRAARGDDASDADVSVYEAQVRGQEPLSPAEQALTLTYRPEEHPSELLVRLCASLDGPGARPVGRPGAGGAADEGLERDPGGPGE